MKVIDVHSHNGADVLLGNLLDEIFAVISDIDAEACRSKISRERSRFGKTLYSPKLINEQFDRRFSAKGWFSKHKLYYGKNNRSISEMDFLHEDRQVGLEVQLGKYAFLDTDLWRRFPLYFKREIIKAGVEIVPSDRLARDMSSGVPCFRQVEDMISELGAEMPMPLLAIGIGI